MQYSIQSPIVSVPKVYLFVCLKQTIEQLKDSRYTYCHIVYFMLENIASVHYEQTVHGL